jgi:hypothetical protein
MDFLGRSLTHPPRAGSVAPELVEPAFVLGVPVLPVAVFGGEVSGHWRVLVGDPIGPPDGRSPLALSDFALRARAGVQELLDEASPPLWLMG